MEFVEGLSFGVLCRVCLPVLRYDDSGPGCEFLEGFPVTQLIEFHQKIDDTSALVASETIEQTLVGIHGKRRGFLAMKWTETEPAASFLDESHLVADYGYGVGLLKNLAYEALGYP
jgi:hypothetical protein